MLFPRKKLVALIYPLIIEQLLAVLVGMVDILMVAAVGESAVAGVSLVDSINILVIQVLAALATGGAVVCSQCIGMKRKDRACFAAEQLTFVSLSLALAILILCLAGGTPFLKLIFGSVEDSVMACSVTYFRITILSFPFLAVYNSCAALFRSMGNSKVSMNVSFLMNAVNIVGNALCIFVFHMGVAGVALPTLFSRFLAAVILLKLAKNPENDIHLTKLTSIRPEAAMIRSILSVAIPNSVESSLFQFGKLILQSLVSTLGTASTAAFAVASTLVNFLYLPGNSMGLGLVTIVGQCVGAKEYKQARYYTRLLVAVDYAFLLILGLTLGFGANFFVNLYNLSPEAHSMAVSLIVVHCFAMLVWPPAFLMAHSLRASMDAKFTMIVAVISMWIFRVGGAYLLILVFHFNVLGVWYAMFADWIFRGTLILLRFRKFPRAAHL